MFIKYIFTIIHDFDRICMLINIIAHSESIVHCGKIEKKANKREEKKREEGRGKVFHFSRSGQQEVDGDTAIVTAAFHLYTS